MDRLDQSVVVRYVARQPMAIERNLHIYCKLTGLNSFNEKGKLKQSKNCKSKTGRFNENKNV